MRVIGVDPSLRATGISIVDLDENRILAWSTIKSETDDSEKKMDDLARRIFELGQAFRSFTAPHLPAVVCVEGQVAASFGGKIMGPATPFKMGTAYGAILVASPSMPLVINPSEVRRRLRGKRDVSKDDIRTYCKAHFGTRHPVEPKAKADREAVWDATAVVLALEPELERLTAIRG